MATSTSSRPLIGQNGPAFDDPESDADTEGRGSADNVNENSVLDGEHSGSQEKEPLSIKRRIALVGALLLCVFTVFAFAFLLPCHKPRCQKTPVCPGISVNWTANFSGIIPGMISLVDMTGYGRPDILVEFDIEAKEVRNSTLLSQICKGKNCHGSGVLAIDGSCGNRLWVFSRNSSFGVMACGGVGGKTDVDDERCLLLEERAKLVLLDAGNGTTKWQTESPTKQEILSFKYINDVDGDGVRDIVFVGVLKDTAREGTINMLSGKTGKVIGGSLLLPGSHRGSNVLAVHALSSAQQFVIVGSVSVTENSTSLWAMSVHDLLEKVKNPTKEIPGIPWGKHQPDPATGFISILKDSMILVQPLLADLDSDGVKDVVFLIKENGISVMAMNGNDLAVMWKRVVPSTVSIHKLFQAQRSVEGNSSDVVLFAKHATNHSSTLLVIDGPTGKIIWSFHSKTGIPVVPIPLLGVSGMKQAFVMWLSKAEALSLIPGHRKSREVQQGSLEDRSASGYTSKKTRKLLSTISRSTGRKVPGHKHHEAIGMDLVSDSFTLSEWPYDYNVVSPDDRFGNSYDDVVNDDIFDSDVEDADMALNKFELGPEQEIRKKDVSDFPYTLKQVFDLPNENTDADRALLSAWRDKNMQFMEKRGSNKDLFPYAKHSKQTFPYSDEGISQQEEKSDQRADLVMHNHDLEQEFRDLTNHREDESLISSQRIFPKASVSSQKKDQAAVKVQKKVEASTIGRKEEDDLMNNQKKDASSISDQKEDGDSLRSPMKDEVFLSSHKQSEQANLVSKHQDDEAFITSQMAARLTDAPSGYPLPHSSSKDFKQYLSEPARIDAMSNLQMASKSDMFQVKQFLTENGKQGDSNLAPAKKPSYQKRSVETSQSGSQCIRSSNDDADSYEAVLLMKDADGRQHIAEITEERPLYLDANEYENLFNVKKGDVKATSCLRLVPSLQAEPVLRDTEEGMDLVYTVSFASEDHSHHVGKVRKMTMSQVFKSLKGLKTSFAAVKHQSKRENDYSFSFPRILK